jgi:nicotinate-nucleotide pyrophosphorylase (carboxylating)
LHAAGLDPAGVARLIGMALAEDLADGLDVTTTATVPPSATAEAWFTPRQPGVLAGCAVALAVLDTVTAAVSSAPIRLLGATADGNTLVPGQPAIRVSGPLPALLTAERTALNLLCHLSGVATATRRWVDAVAGTGARIRDTRKTMPGMRALEKYAVRCGGGTNHRMSLGDAALIKDNHVAAAGSVTAAVQAVRALRPDIALEVEVDTLEQLLEALDAGARLILLDNFTTEQTEAAVRLVRYRELDVQLESSGGLTLDRAAEIAATGVDFLAVGALTHSSPALDIGLDIQLGTIRTGD